MFKETKLTFSEIMSLSNALRLIQEAETNTISEDGDRILKVNAFPPSTANKIRNQKSKIKDLVDDFQETVKASVEKANEKAKEEEDKTSIQILNELLDALSKEEREVEILNKPLKYSGNKDRSDFGGLHLKSEILELVPDGFIEFVE